MSCFGRLVYKVAVPALLLLSCSDSPLLARDGDAKGKLEAALSNAIRKATDYSRWNGNWELIKCRYESNVAVVAVTMSGAKTGAPTMVAVFLSGEGDCEFGSGDKERGAFFWAKAEGLKTNKDDGKIVGIILRGKISFCTTDKALADANNLTAVFKCDFDGIFDPSSDTITGHAKGEKYYSPASNSNSKQYTRVAAEDPDVEVILHLVHGRPRPQEPSDTKPDPTPTPDPRIAINNALMNWINNGIEWDKDRIKNQERIKNQ